MPRTSHTRRTPAVLAALLLGAGCADEWSELYESRGHDGDPFFTAQEWEQIQTLTRPARAWRENDYGITLIEPLPPEPSNLWADDRDAAELGQALFFDPNYSPDDAYGQPRACDSCHPTDAWYARGQDSPTAPDITTVLNNGYYRTHTWTGRRDTLWGLALTPAEGFLESNRYAIAQHVAAEYREDYERIFGIDAEVRDFFDDPTSFPSGTSDSGAFLDSKDPALANIAADQKAPVDRIFANFGKALSAYMRACVTGPSRFDRYVSDLRTAADETNGLETWEVLNESEKRGLRLFVSGQTNCIACHSGPMLTDNDFHDIAITAHVSPQEDRTWGLGKLAAWEFTADSRFSDDPNGVVVRPEPVEADDGAYRTPSLRNVAQTGPYMHSSRFQTLGEVIEHYNDPPDSGDGLRDPKLWAADLTTDEKDDLEAFLRTLTAEQPFTGDLSRDPFRAARRTD